MEISQSIISMFLKIKSEARNFYINKIYLLFLLLYALYSIIFIMSKIEASVSISTTNFVFRLSRSAQFNHRGLPDDPYHGPDVLLLPHEIDDGKIQSAERSNMILMKRNLMFLSFNYFTCSSITLLTSSTVSEEIPSI